MRQTIRIEGLVELIRKADAADYDTRVAVRNLVRDVGNKVAGDARSRFMSQRINSPRTARGFRPYVRRAGAVMVEQSEKKTTGRRPDWGRTQMRKGLLPAVDDQQEATQRELEAAVASITSRYF